MSIWLSGDGFSCRSLQGNKLTGRIPEVIGLMQALAVLYVIFIFKCLLFS